MPKWYSDTQPPALPRHSVRITPTRLLAAGALAALAIAIGGFIADAIRFGTSESATRGKVEAFVRSAFARRAEELGRLSQSADPLGPAVGRATSNRDVLPQVFLRVAELANGSGDGSSSLTIYSPDYRPLAWSDGPAEDLAPERLRGGDSLFVTEGTLGLRLVRTRQLRVDGRLVGTAAAETLLSLNVGGSADRHLAFPTPYGDFTLVLPTLSSAADNLTQPNAFVVSGPDGRPLVEARFEPSEIRGHRRLFRQRVAALAGVPIVVALLLGAAPLIERRRHAPRRAPFLGWTLACAALVSAAAALAAGLAFLAGWDAEARLPLASLLMLALTAIGPGSWWFRRRERRQPRQHWVPFVAEQSAAGAAAGAALVAVLAFLDRRFATSPFDHWEFPLLPLRLPSALGFAGTLLVTASLLWSAAMILAIVAERWRVSRRPTAQSVAAMTVWLGAIAVVALAWRAAGHAMPGAGMAVMAAAVAVFGLLGGAVRHHYRHTTQAARLGLLYAALFVPCAASYPLSQSVADATARHIIESDYSLQVQQAAQPQYLQAELSRAQAEIDAFPGLADIVNRAPQTPTQAAYTVWSQTRLARNRTTSAIELYDADGALVSRFALNVPEYGAPGAGDRVSTCQWTQSGEAGRFGAEERRMLRGERAMCGRAGGPPRGAIVVHLMPDYRALPFVSSDDPYYDVLRPGDKDRGSRIGDLQVAVYGWGLLPAFASGNVAWPLTPELANRLALSRQPFWTDLRSADRPYHVHFTNDRGGIYAVGYPVATAFEHVTRLAEGATLLFIVFVLLLLGATAFGPFSRRHAAPLRVLVTEVRTSFYRKLFLYFVFAAVGPIVVLSLVFGAYMGDKFRADVRNEATNVVTVARRVFEELLTLQDSAPTDDVLVWIGGAINQDVNLFSGSQLVATSQRDLFDSGLLPTRTPASVYRSIALDRLPSYTGDDRIGGFSYLIAAAPVPARGRETILSIPLALRQREIAREIDELNRGVLVGAALVVVLVAALGLYVAGRVSTPVSRLTRATRQIAAGKLDVRIAADTADELRRLVDDFNLMAATLAAQRDELARSHQLKAWADMARQVAHEIKNPLTPIQLSAEHLRRVHADAGRPVGPVFDTCLDTILRQVRLLRQIAGEFSNFAASPVPQIEAVDLDAFLQDVVAPYQVAGDAVRTSLRVAPGLPPVSADRTLLARAVTNIIENARQAMPSGGDLSVVADASDGAVAVVVTDSGVGMDDAARARAFEPYFSTKTGGSGLGLPNAKRNVELCGGTLTLDSERGRGTVITIRLRRAAADRPGGSASA